MRTLCIRTFFLFIFFCVSLFGETDVRKEYSTFLKNLGFEDYPAKIRYQLEYGKGAGAVSESVLDFNARRYQVVNDARDLTVEIMARLEETRLNSPTRDKIVDFTARMLNHRPFAPPTEIPERYLNLPERERNQAVERYLLEVTSRKIARHTEMVAADVVNILFTPEELARVARALESGKRVPAEEQALLDRVKEVTALSKRLVQFSYADGEAGLTSYLGRGLAAGIAKFNQKDGRDGILEKLKKRTAREGIALESFIGDSRFVGVVTDGKSGRKKISLQNGDFVMTRGLGRESHAIASGSRPAWQNAWRAHSRGLVAPIVAPVIAPDEEASPSTLNSVRESIAANRLFNRGFAHVGMVTVLEDKETGIRMPWVLDSYYNMEEGGIRFIGFEQFAPRGTVTRFGVSRYDPEKFYDFVQREIKRHGYSGEAVPAFKEQYGGKNRGKAGEPDPYLTQITEEGFKALHEVPRTQAKEWFNNVMEKITDHIRINMMTRDGLGFDDDFAARKGRTYCSQCLVLAAKQAAGIELQKYFDHWHLAGRAMKLLGNSELDGMRMDQRIIAPGGFTWQPFTREWDSVEYERLPVAQREAVLFQPEDVEASEKAAKALERIARQDAGLRRMLSGPDGTTLDQVGTHLGIFDRIEALEDRSRGETSVEELMNQRGRQNGDRGSHQRRTTPAGYIGACNDILARIGSGRPSSKLK